MSNNYSIETPKQNAEEVAQQILEKMKLNKWDDKVYRRQYFKEYYKNSELLYCEVCHKEYKRSIGKTKHLISKRHIEFLHKTV
jgi:hypothetical protein